MSELPVRTALLSYGMSGEVFHAPLISANPGFELVSIVERRSSRSSAHFPDVKIMRSVDDVISDPQVELVIVNTPNETHFDFASRAMLAGKHVVVEKPFTVTLDEGRELIEIAKTTQRILTVFQNRRWDSDFLTVRRVLQEGRLGKIAEVSAHYDRFRNYIEPNTWKEEAKPGTGILYNLGSHMLDQMVVLFGLPEWVDARIGIQRPGGKVDDFYDIRMEYANHLVIVKSSYLVKATMPRYIIHGVNGSFVKFGIDPQEQALKEKRKIDDPSWGVEESGQWGKLSILEDGNNIEVTVPSARGDYNAFYDNVFGAIRNKAALAVRPAESLEVIRLIEACYESSRRKSAVRVAGQ